MQKTILIRLVIRIVLAVNDGLDLVSDGLLHWLLPELFLKNDKIVEKMKPNAQLMNYFVEIQKNMEMNVFENVLEVGLHDLDSVVDYFGHLSKDSICATSPPWWSVDAWWIANLRRIW